MLCKHSIASIDNISGTGQVRLTGGDGAAQLSPGLPLARSRHSPNDTQHGSAKEARRIEDGWRYLLAPGNPPLERFSWCLR